MAGTSAISIEVANSIPANYIVPPKRDDLSAFLGRVGHIDRRPNVGVSLPKTGTCKYIGRKNVLWLET